MKAYVKPQLQVEYFTLSQNIATDCNVPSGTTLGKPNHGDRANCGWDLGGWVVWTDYAHKCVDEQTPDKNIVGLCYNNPNGGCTIFSS